MKVYTGIDLGSTTTKAVVVDEQGRVAGRGITNSRSNYLAACKVARSEAFINARMSQFRSALEAAGGRVADLLPRIERHYRLGQYVEQLERLAEVMLRGLLVSSGLALKPVIDTILQAMLDEAPALVASEHRKSDFFRDIAGASYQALAEKLADPRTAPFDALIGQFDRSILVVENEVSERGFAAQAGPALAGAMSELGLELVEQERLQGVLAMVTARELEEAASVGTGYGRARLPFPKSQIRSEILCHGLGAHAMFPRTATVLDIGGQDTKAIQLDESGIVTSFQMNDRCAAGCGRYLGYIADELNMGLHELGPMALGARRKVRINSTCTVFAGAELRDRLGLGERREDILAGLHRAIILRAMSLLARSGGVRDEFSFTGGVAKNGAAVKALQELVAENYGAMTINISAESIYTGALGAALFASRDEGLSEEVA